MSKETTGVLGEESLARAPEKAGAALRLNAPLFSLRKERTFRVHGINPTVAIEPPPPLRHVGEQIDTCPLLKLYHGLDSPFHYEPQEC